MYILGKFLQDRKPVHIALKEIFGIGFSLSERLCAPIGANRRSKIGDLSTSQISKLTLLLEVWANPKQNSTMYNLIEDDLKRSRNTSISNLLSVNNYRGSRHAKRLPCRGQRTKTNSRTARQMRRKI
jgi:small subunit ribosomal protein S13